jgi:hypothetical protein
MRVEIVKRQVLIVIFQEIKFEIGRGEMLLLLNQQILITTSQSTRVFIHTPAEPFVPVSRMLKHEAETSLLARR